MGLGAYLLGSAAISGLGSIAGSILNYNATNKSIASQNRANILNYQAQKEFAQNSIYWRKQDALKSGISPIYALGANSAQFSPSFIGTSPNTALGDGLTNASQNIADSINASLQLELQNKLIDSQVAENKARTALIEAQTNELTGGSSGVNTLNPAGVASKVIKSTTNPTHSAPSSTKKLAEGDFGNKFVPNTNNHFVIRNTGDKDRISIDFSSQTHRDNITEKGGIAQAIWYSLKTNKAPYGLPRYIEDNGIIYEYSPFLSYIENGIEYTRASRVVNYNMSADDYKEYVRNLSK